MTALASLHSKTVKRTTSAAVSSSPVVLPRRVVLPCPHAGAAAPPASGGLIDTTLDYTKDRTYQRLGMPMPLYEYLQSHTREPHVLARLRHSSKSTYVPAQDEGIAIPPEQGAMLSMLVEMNQPKRIIEVGTFTGYLSAALALAMPAGGKLFTLDPNPKNAEKARPVWTEAGVLDKVEAVVGPAGDSLERMLAKDGEGCVDFAFVDADKKKYDKYYELLLKLLRPGGLLVLDNCLWYGRVADPMAQDEYTLALKDLNDKILTDARVSACIVPVGDGMVVCRRR